MTTAVEASPGRGTTVHDVLFLSRRLDVMGGVAKEYARHHVRNGGSFHQEGMVERATAAMEDLYTITRSTEEKGAEMQRFRRNWGEETDVFLGYMPRVLERLDRAHSELYDSKISFCQRLVKPIQIGWEGIKVLKKLKGSDERQRLFMAVGTSEDEVSKQLKNLGKSSALSIVSASAMLSVVGSSVLEGAANPFLADISDPKTQAVVVSSYIAHYSLLMLNKLESVRLLKSKVHNSPHVTATGLFYLLEKANPKVRDTVTTVAPTIPFWIEEIGFIPSIVLLGPAGTSAAALRNLGLAGLNAVEAGLSEVWLRLKGKEKVVFEIAPQPAATDFGG